jgi:uncharacterized membrane protein
MQELILAKTSLPNLHPAIVHFPIVLLIVALLLDIVALFAGSRVWLRKAAILLSVLGAVAAGFTFLTGRQAAQTVAIPLAAETAISRHETFALYTLWFFGVYAAVRLALQIVTYRRWIHVVMIVIGLVGQGLLLQTADLGGSLVYKHALGVTLPKPKQEPIVKASQESVGPVTNQNEITWKFGRGSEAKVAEHFEAKQGALSDAHFATGENSGKTYLTIHKTTESRLLLTFKPSYGDMQIESEMDRSEFTGVISLVHHVNAAGYDFFSIESNVLQLGRKSGSEEKTFHRKPIQISPGFQHYRAVGSGTHFRGYMDGKLAVHGHGKAAPAGQAGILLEGTGTLKISQISVHRLDEHSQHQEE